jgi:hypothetical protein
MVWKLSRPDAAVRADMQAAVEAYRGQVTKYPPGVARGHEIKESYGYGSARPEKRLRQDVAPGNGRQPRQP